MSASANDEQSEIKNYTFYIECYYGYGNTDRTPDWVETFETENTFVEYTQTAHSNDTWLCYVIVKDAAGNETKSNIVEVKTYTNEPTWFYLNNL